MQIYFWGTRGSLPASLKCGAVRGKIAHALSESRGRRLDTNEEINSFIEQLPFSVAGTYGGNTSCVEVGGLGQYFLFDAGTGLRDFGNTVASTLKTPGVFNLFISHLHWDHIQGFPFFWPAYMPGNTVNIFGCHDDIEKALAQQQSEPFFPAPLSVMRSKINFFRLEEDRDYEIGGATVHAIRQNHPGVSYGYRVKAQGKTFVYSTDSEYLDNALDDSHPFIAFARDADLLIYDAQYSFADSAVNKERWGHSSNILGVDQAVKARVKHLCLFHNEHTCNDLEFESFLLKTREYLSLTAPDSKLRIDLAYDGLAINL